MQSEMRTDTPSIEADIIDIGDGNVLGRLDDGMLVWLTGDAIPGDRVLVEVTRRKKRFWEGHAIRRVQDSSDRIQAPCPYFSKCPGCLLQNLAPEATAHLKEKKTIQALQRIGKISPLPWLGYEAAIDEYGYRNKLDLSCENGHAGYRMRSGFLPVTRCLLGMPVLQETLEQITPTLLAAGKSLSRLTMRCDETQENVLVLLTGPLSVDERKTWRDFAKSHEHISGILARKDSRKDWMRIVGNDSLVFELAQETHEVPADGFFQVNSVQADRLVRRCVDWVCESVADGSEILDLYGGVGTFTRPLLRNGYPVHCVDVMRPPRLDLAGYQQVNLDKGLKKVLQRIDAQPTCVLLNPPRTGCSQQILDDVCALDGLEHIFYVSCNPATLARDGARLQTAGYELRLACGFDLFPQTPHTETLTEWTKLQR